MKVALRVESEWIHLLIEDTGLGRYARDEGLTLEEGFQTLITGLAVRYYKAING